MSNEEHVVTSANEYEKANAQKPSAMPYARYQSFTSIDLPDRTWPNAVIETPQNPRPRAVAPCEHLIYRFNETCRHCTGKEPQAIEGRPEGLNVLWNEKKYAMSQKKSNDGILMWV